MRDNAARAFVPAFLVLGLVGLVGIASTGSRDGGTREVRPPSEAVLDTFFSFVLVLLVISAVLVAYGLMQRNAIAQEMARNRRYRRLSLIGFAVFMFLLTLLAYLRLRDWKSAEFVDELGEQGFPRGVPRPPQETGAGSAYEPEFVWTPVIVIIALVALAVAAWYIALRREAVRPTDEDALSEAIALVLDDTLDDLRAEEDARRAVIAAYARLERVLGAYGLGRDPAETPQEYLKRILPRLELERGSVRRLTDLFTRAKFSPHEVDLGMKDAAIDALTTVRDELRAADERRRKQVLPAIDTAAERP